MPRLCLDFISPECTIRCTEESPVRYSVMDIIKAICQPKKSTVYNVLNRIKEEYPEISSADCLYKFPGQGQGIQPVVEALKLAQIIMVLPGPVAAKYRHQCASMFVRIVGGDPSVIADIQQIQMSVNPVAAFMGDSNDADKIQDEPKENESSGSQEEEHVFTPGSRIGSQDQQVMSAEGLPVAMQFQMPFAPIPIYQFLGDQLMTADMTNRVHEAAFNMWSEQCKFQTELMHKHMGKYVDKMMACHLKVMQQKANTVQQMERARCAEARLRAIHAESDAYNAKVDAQNLKTVRMGAKRSKVSDKESPTYANVLGQE
eukprot:754549-Hanusia_phi.AAC.3